MAAARVSPLHGLRPNESRNPVPGDCSSPIEHERLVSMHVRPLILATTILVLSLGVAGCGGGGVKDGMPADFTEDPENAKQEKAVADENLRLMKNPLNAQKK